MKKRKGQEEMIGFAMIIIIVAVILLVFLGFSLRNSPRENVESYEVESFIQASLQYSTDCRDRTNDIQSLQDLITGCNSGDTCSDGRRECEVLGSVLGGIMDTSWPVGPDRPAKGYEINITSDTKEIFSLSKGNFTYSVKGSSQPLSRGGIRFEMKVYS